MHIILNNTSLIPIYEQLVEQIKNLIISGELAENTILPSVRAMASELKISALTVKKAYDKLEEDGFVVTVHGKGTYVAETDGSKAQEARCKAIEDELIQLVTKAHGVGMSSDDIRAMLDIILEE